ncbi:MAG: TolC family protein [Acidobacteriota bacterium]|nr:TolC family protein [Acidobacteriota bacterium]
MKRVDCAGCCRPVFSLLVILAAMLPTLAADPEPLSLSLADVVARALEHNLDIAVARLDPRRDEQGVVISEAVFDSRVEANASYTEISQEPTSDFSLESQTSKRASVAWIDPLQSGGSWQASLAYNELIQTFPAEAEARFGIVPTRADASFTLQFTQPLLRNYGLSINRTQIEQAKNTLRITEAQFRDRVMEVIEAVEAAYWDLVGARRQQAVAERSMKLAEDFLRQTKVKVEVGTLPPIEITTAEAEVAGRDEALIVAENEVRDAEDNLRALMRVPSTSADWDRPIFPTDQPPFYPVELDEDLAIEQALARRASLVQAELNLKNAELSEKWRRNQVRWDLSANASYTTSGNSFDFVPGTGSSTVLDFFGPDGIFLSGDEQGRAFEVQFDRLVREDQSKTEAFSELPSLDNTNWTVALSLKVPLGNRNARAELARARIALDQAALRVDATRQALRVEVRQAVRSVRTASRRVHSAQVNAELQKKKTDAEQKRYENGLSTAYQVLQFQRDFLEAESREIRAIIDYNKALSRLERVKGTLLEARRIHLD